MAKLAEDRDTRRREGIFFAFEAAERIYTGSLVALDSDGKAVAATASGGVVVGVAEEGKKPGETVSARRGCFAFDNDTASPLSLADVGSLVVVVDDHTVGNAGAAAAAETQTAAAIAGTMLGLDENGVWVKI